MPSDQKRAPGRPRKWSSEAERKRAYRQRRATALAEPMRLQEMARAAEAAAAQAEARAEMALRQAESWRRRAETAQKKAGNAREQARRARERAQRSTAERDEARRLLRRKVQRAGQAATDPRLRDNPAALLAVIADLHVELDRLRAENMRFRRITGWVPMMNSPGGRNDMN